MATPRLNNFTSTISRWPITCAPKPRRSRCLPRRSLGRRRANLAAGDILAEETLAIDRRVGAARLFHPQSFCALSVEIKQKAPVWVGVVLSLAELFFIAHPVSRGFRDH